MWNKGLTVQEIVTKAVLGHEPGLLSEMRERHMQIGFVYGAITDALEIPDHVNGCWKYPIVFEAFMAFILHLLKDRNVKVFNISEGFEADFIEWKISPEEAVDRIRKLWPVINQPGHRIEDIPWFLLEDDDEQEVNS